MNAPGCLDIARAAGLDPGQVRGNEHFFRCPRHDDREPSLRVNPAKKGFSCKPCGVEGNWWAFASFLAGVDRGNKPAVTAYLKSIGLMDERNTGAHSKRMIAATYPYTDESGNLLFEVVRFEPKGFRQRRPDGKGGWIWNIEGIRRVPYNLPELIKAEYVFIVEGEKDVESLRGIGLTATCNPGGALKWTAELSQYFRAGQRVAIIPDNDKTGRDHIQQVASLLHGRVGELRMLELAGLPEKGDVSDWLIGRDPVEAAEELSRLSEAAPEYKPPDPEDLDPWEPCTFMLCDAFKPRPPREYLIEGLLPLPSLSVVYGAPGSLKSLLLADAAVCVAAGHPWLQLDPSDPGRKTLRSPVYWLDFDNGPDATHERFAALARSRSVPPDVPLYYATMPSPCLDACDPSQIDSLEGRLKARSVRLVVIDNLRVVSGRADENKPEIGTVMSHFRALAERLRIAIVLLHHPCKGDDEVLRGHGSINAALDLALHVRRQPSSDTIKVAATKTRGALVQPFGAQFCYSHKSGLHELETARFWASGGKDMTGDLAIRSCLTELLKNWPEKQAPCKTEIVDRAKSVLQGIGIQRIGRAIDALVAEKQWNEQTGAKNSRRYSINTGSVF